VRIAELTGSGHWSVLWSQATATRVLEWLQPMAAATAGGEPAERTAGWAIAGWLAALVVIWELPRALRKLWLPALDGASPAALARGAAAGMGLLSAAVVVALAPDAIASALPLAGAREALALLALSGVITLLLAAPGYAGALRRAGTWLGGAALAGALHLIAGPLLAPWLDPWPAPHRLVPIALASAAALPHFAALEWLRSRGWAGAVLPALGRALAIALVAGAAVAGMLPDTALTAARCLLLGAPLLELLGQSCARIAPNPWTAALAQSLAVGWILGTLFPLEG
jgi:hypothetical protein